MSIAKGDLVRLKSGGPIMTVDDTRCAELRCYWFLNGQVLMHSFRDHSLERVESRPVGGESGYTLTPPRP
jgi:uncharacterized protein YodC (DUF2158 family)